MNETIFGIFKNGNSGVKLAIVADIVTIAGVSIASMLGGFLAIMKNIDTLSVMDILGVVATSLATLVVFSLYIAFFIYAVTESSSYFSGKFSEKIIYRYLLMCPIVSLLLLMMIIISIVCYEVFASLPAFR